MPRLCLEPQIHTTAPSVNIGRECDHIKLARDPVAFEKAAPVANNRHAQSGVPGVIGLDERKQPGVKRGGIHGHRHVQQPGVFVHARPVALKGEQDADSERRMVENTPQPLRYPTCPAEMDCAEVGRIRPL